MNYGRLKQLLVFSALLFCSVSRLHATPVTLDFSSGAYIQRPPLNYVNLYEQDGFSVYTEDSLHQFHETFGSYGPRLAWYEGDTVIRVDGPALFTLTSIDVPTAAFAGLEFTSSKGDVVTAGSGTGTIFFTGPGWSGMKFFTVNTRTGFDILTELDNFVVATVPLPSAVVLFLSGVIGIVALKRRGQYT